MLYTKLGFGWPVWFKPVWFERKYSRVDLLNFAEDSFYQISRDMVCLSRPYPLKLFKGCLPQNLISLLFNTLSHLALRKSETNFFHSIIVYEKRTFIDVCSAIECFTMIKITIAAEIKPWRNQLIKTFWQFTWLRNFKECTQPFKPSPKS